MVFTWALRAAVATAVGMVVGMVLGQLMAFKTVRAVLALAKHQKRIADLLDPKLPGIPHVIVRQCDPGEMRE